jgi:hypothetical protein
MIISQAANNLCATLAAHLRCCNNPQPQLSCNRASAIVILGCLSRLCSAAALTRLLRCALQGGMRQYAAAGAATSTCENPQQHTMREHNQHCCHIAEDEVGGAAILL